MQPSEAHTTTLREIRGFLKAEGAAPPPWAAPQESLAALHAQLAARRGDDAFWARLGGLARRLDDRRVDLGRLAGSEAFGHATIEELLADLRADLGAGDGAPRISWRQALAGPLRATSLAAFLVLGTAAAASCGDDDEGSTGGDTDTDSDSDTDADTDTDTELCEEALDWGITGEAGAIYCALVEIVEASDLSILQKGDLLECLPGLDAAYRESLLDAFSSMTDDQINDALLAMLAPDGVCYDDDTGGSH